MLVGAVLAVAWTPASGDASPALTADREGSLESDHAYIQVIHLDFDGAVGIDFTGDFVVEDIDVPVFNLEAAGLAGLEHVVIGMVHAELAADPMFDTVLFTLEPPKDAGEHSTIYIGGTDGPFRQHGTFTSIAEGFDEGNRDWTDVGFVFSEALLVDVASLLDVTNAVVAEIRGVSGRLVGTLSGAPDRGADFVWDVEDLDPGDGIYVVHHHYDLPLGEHSILLNGILGDCGGCEYAYDIKWKVARWGEPWENPDNDTSACLNGYWDPTLTHTYTFPDPPENDPRWSIAAEIRDDCETLVEVHLGTLHFALPDLRVTNISHPDSLVAGESFRMVPRVCNEGSGASSSSTVTYYFGSEDDSDSLGPIGPGDCDEDEQSGWFNGPSSAGNYTVQVTVSGGGSDPHPRTENWYWAAPPEPDLEIDSVNVIGTDFVVGDDFRIETVICNEGDAYANNVLIKYYFDGAEVDTDELSWGLGPGDCDGGETSDWISGPSEAGNYVVTVEVYEDGDLHDSDSESHYFSPVLDPPNFHSSPVYQTWESAEIGLTPVSGSDGPDVTFDVEFAVAGTGNWTAAPSGQSDHWHQIIGPLQGNTTYDVRVRACQPGVACSDWNTRTSYFTSATRTVEITGFSVPTGSHSRGDVVTATMTIKNHGSGRYFWPAMSYSHEMGEFSTWPRYWYDLEPQKIFVPSNQTKTVTFNCVIPANARSGDYFGACAVWDDYDGPSNLMVDVLDYGVVYRDDVLRGANSFALGAFVGTPLSIVDQILEAALRTSTPGMPSGDTVANRYLDGAKPLWFFGIDSAITLPTNGPPIDIEAGGSVLFDLADLVAATSEGPITPEGQDGWVTVWVDARGALGTSVGYSLPLEVQWQTGIIYHDFEDFGNRAVADDRQELILGGQIQFGGFAFTLAEWSTDGGWSGPRLDWNGPNSKVGIKGTGVLTGLVQAEVRRDWLTQAIDASLQSGGSLKEWAENFQAALNNGGVFRDATLDDGAWRLYDGISDADLQLDIDWDSEPGVAHYFVINVADGTSRLQVITADGSGDADLYIRWGERPTPGSFFKRSVEEGTNAESVTVDSPQAGEWYIAIPANSSYTGVRVVATLEDGTPDPTGACCVGTSCSVVTPGECNAMGGTYVGNDTNCSGAPCDGGGCPAGEIEDCNGNCCPEDWVGDGYCDDGANEWNGVPIYLNCDQFDCDGGDCQPSQCEGGSDSTGACCFGSSCDGGYLEIICETSGGVWQGPNSDCSSDLCGGTTYDVCPAGCAFTDIQSAIDASSPGAIITVGPGVYSIPASQSRMVEMPGHDVQLVAPQGAIIDGGNNYSGVYWATSPPPTTASRLEGFTIRNCSGGDGGGMTLYGDVEIHDCVFQNNVASVVGGGVAIKEGGNPTFVDCSFTGNVAGAQGGGIYLQDEGSSLTLEGCLFLNNEAFHGGGFGTEEVGQGGTPKPDSLTMVDCTFIANTAHHGAGGFSAVKVVSMMNCSFIDNVAEGDQSSLSGGGWSAQCPTMSITDSLFVRNHAGIQGGGLYAFNSASNVTILGTSFTENTAGLAGRGGGIQIDDGVCDVTSGSFCGNQPLDYAGDGITIDSSVCLPVDCTDTDGNGVADACECPTDINGDSVTDIDDLMIFIARFGEFCDGELYPDCDPDFDGDGWVTISDLLYLLDSWGPCEPDG